VVKDSTSHISISKKDQVSKFQSNLAGNLDVLDEQFHNPDPIRDPITERILRTLPFLRLWQGPPDGLFWPLWSHLHKNLHIRSIPTAKHSVIFYQWQLAFDLGAHFEI